MNEYELLYVVSPRLTADEVEGTVQRVGSLIEGAGGEILMVDNWGRRRLAYPIKHHFEGTYVLTHLRLDSAQIAGLERSLQINEDVLRHLLTRDIIPGYEGPPEQEVHETRRPVDRGPAPRAEEGDEAASDAAPASDGDAESSEGERPADDASPAANEAGEAADAEEAPSPATTAAE